MTGDSAVPKIGLAKMEPNQEVVDFLTEALERAKNGETVGVLILEQDNVGGCIYSLVNIKDRFTSMGYLSHAIYKLQADRT